MVFVVTLGLGPDAAVGASWVRGWFAAGHPFLTYPSASNLGWSSDRMLRNREAWMVIGILAVSAFLLYRAHRVPPRPEVVPLGTPAPAAPPVSGS